MYLGYLIQLLFIFIYGFYKSLDYNFDAILIKTMHTLWMLFLSFIPKRS